MLRLVIVLLAVSGALALPTRIVGGSDAAPGQYPYQISMQRRPGGLMQHHCGGSILNPNWILTAAHCVINNSPNDFMIVTGITYLSDPGQQHAISQMLYHADYNPQTMQNDIALIQVAGSIQYGPTVQPVSLYSGEVPSGSPLVLSGWGITSYPGQAPPNTLQQITLTAISTGECQARAQGAVITNNQVCTLEPAGRGACQGDSGGPLMYNGQQCGVVSWGRPCALGDPDVFTKVAPFIAWIRSIAG